MDKIKVLAIGAHNDEIMADMGGTSYKLYQKGCEVVHLNLACSWKEDGLTDEKKAEYARQENLSSEILGAKFEILGGRDDYFLFAENKDIIEETTEYIVNFKPDIVFIHPMRDNHVEHREVAQVSMKALISAWIKGVRFREVYAFDTGTNQSMDYFSPHFFVNMEDALDKACESLEAYNQKHANGKYLSDKYKIKRSYRGFCAGVNYAEAFKIVKFPNRSDDILLKQLLGKDFIWMGNGMYPCFGEEYF